MKKFLFGVFAFAVAIGLVGGVAQAFLTDSLTKENKASVGNNKIDVIEEFEQPDEWQVNTTYTKTAKVKNTGLVSCWVRVYLGCSNNDMISSLNLDLTNWVKNGDYYYYKKVLEVNQETTQLLKSVKTSSTVNKEDFEVYVYAESVQDEGYTSYTQAFDDIK